MKTVILTGASSGIGRELALEFAKRGFNLGLLARRVQLLNSVKNEILKLHPTIQVEIFPLDITIYTEIYPAFKYLSSKLGRISHVIANAGVAGSKEVGSSDFLHDKRVIETNLIAGMAIIEASVKIFREQNTPGHIIGISSIAGTRGFPKNASYSASKAGFTNYLEAARIDLKKQNILVSTILPGFIDTDMNSHMKTRPFLISANKGAKIIIDKIEQKKEVAIIPNFPWSILTFLMKRIPDFIWQRIPFE